jgi:hypothetical protein
VALTEAMAASLGGLNIVKRESVELKGKGSAALVEIAAAT